MRKLTDLWFRVRAFFGGRRMDREFRDEMAHHLELETRELVQNGMDPVEARRQAIMAFGGEEVYREKARDARGTRSFEDLIQDIRHALRTLRKSPLTSGVILLVLTLGIGASASIFSVVDGILFRPLPFPNADGIVQVFSSEPDDPRGTFSGADYLDIVAQSEAFQGMAGYQTRNINLVQETGPQRLRGASVTPGFFQVFGVQPFLGRTLSPGADGPGQAPTVVLSHGLWESAFGADAEIVGRVVDLNYQMREVVGVMPPDFDYPGVSLWTSSAYNVPDPPVEGAENPDLDRGAEYISIIGHLQESVSIEEARAELSLISQRLNEDYPEVHEGEAIAALPLQEVLTESIRPTLQLLLAAVGILLLVACGNVANLLLARASGRRQEMSLRRALGASRWRLASQILTESTLLAGGGGILGALFAVGCTAGLMRLAPAGIPRADEVGVDLRFVVFATLISLVVGVVSGLLPALRSSQEDGGGGALFSGTRQAGARGRSRTRRALIIGEVAFSLVLMVGAGLMVRTLLALNRVDPGFQPEQTMAAHLFLPEARYESDAEISDFARRVEESLRDRPGIQAAGLVLSLPIRAGLSGRFSFSIEGYVPQEGNEPFGGYQIATPGYFEALGISTLRGRSFTEADGALDPRVVVVNEALAEAFWPGGDPIGQRVTWDDPEGEDVEWSTIVGVVENSLQGGLDQDPRPEVFRLYSQAPISYMTVVARGEMGTAALAGALRETVLEIDGRIPLYGMATMEELLSDSLGQRRFFMSLLATFASMALVLAAVGLYGVLRYGVSQRAREVGIQVALGARAGRIAKGVVGEGLILTLLGLALGLALALPATHFMSGLLFRIHSWDPATYLISGVILTLVAAAACGPPAFKAARTDPMIALREE